MNHYIIQEIIFFYNINKTVIIYLQSGILILNATTKMFVSLKKRDSRFDSSMWFLFLRINRSNFTQKMEGSNRLFYSYRALIESLCQRTSTSIPDHILKVNTTYKIDVKNLFDIDAGALSSCK